jgi:hypothetical protein
MKCGFYYSELALLAVLALGAICSLGLIVRGML